MRVRLQVLLPLALAVLVGAGFLSVAFTVGDAVRGASPGEAPGAAIRVVLLWGALLTIAAAVAGAVIARFVVQPLRRMRESAQRLAEARGESEEASPVAEIQDIVRGISRAAGELRDRHARELRERTELIALVDAVSEGILQVDAEGRIVRVNRAGRTLLGLPANAAGRAVASLVRNLELRQLLERSGRRATGDTAEVVLDDRRILVSSMPLPDGGAAITFVDLTDLRRLEEIRRDFVANASHELKTPLTSIRGYAETLRTGDLPGAEQRQFLETIARNAERLQRIVDDLLDLSRLESGRWRPEIGPVDIAEVAEACWQAFADRARRRNVSWRLDSDLDAPRAAADHRALDQVFTNLYDNALRHTPPEGSIRVRLRASQDHGPPADGAARRVPQMPSPDGWIIAEVADTGAGIPRDALPRVFERFYRVDPARSRAEGGTGLGLSIVKHMMDSMGGSVAAESELGKGTTVRLWLPRA